MANNIDLRGRALPSLELRPGADASFGLTLNNIELTGLTVAARIGQHALEVGPPDSESRRMVVTIDRSITSQLAAVEPLSIWLVDADGKVTAVAYGSVHTDTSRPV